MSLNWKEIDAVLEELKLKEYFVQNIVQPNFDSLVLYLYQEAKPLTLFMSLASGSCRLHETRRKIPKNPKPLRFMELLKKRILGFKIISAKQLGEERVIQIVLQNNSERLFLFIRLWSGSANIILTDENMLIIDAFYRRPKKNEITGAVFSLSDIVKEPDIKPNKKTETKTDTKTDKKYELRNFDELLKQSSEMILNSDLNQLSLSEKIEIYYDLSEKNEVSLESLQEKAQKYFEKNELKLDKILKNIEAKKSEFLNREVLKTKGDLILSNAHLVEKEQKMLLCFDYSTNSDISIELDPKKNPQENAQDYYKKYKKAETGYEALIFESETIEKEKRILAEEKKRILAEKNPLRLEQLLREIEKNTQEIPKQVGDKQSNKKQRPGLLFSYDDWTLFVGRNANENDALLRHFARGLDTWFHTRDVQGGFVFIKNKPGKTIPLPVLIAAGNLAVYFSKAREEGRADLYYTQVKHLKRAQGGKKSEKSSLKGKVLPENEKNLHIKLDMTILRQLGIS